jgi:hypothetical protein
MLVSQHNSKNIHETDRCLQVKHPRAERLGTNWEDIALVSLGGCGREYADNRTRDASILDRSAGDQNSERGTSRVMLCKAVSILPDI